MLFRIKQLNLFNLIRKMCGESKSKMCASVFGKSEVLKNKGISIATGT